MSMKKSILLGTLFTLAFFVACKKENKHLSDLNLPQQDADKKAGLKLIPQKNLNLDSEELIQLVKNFKAKGISTLDKLSQPGFSNSGEALEVDYAVSVVEASLNFDFDRAYDDSYDTYTKEVSFTVPLDEATHKLSITDVENVYDQFTAFIQEDVSNEVLLQVIDIEAYESIDGTATVTFAGSAVFFTNTYSHPCGSLPVTWNDAPVNSYRFFQYLPSFCGPGSFSGAVPTINGRLNCTSVKIVPQCPYGYFWSSVIDYYNPGSPYITSYGNSNSSLYSSGLKSNSWYCNWSPVNNLYPNDINQFRIAIDAEANLNRPSSLYQIINKRVIDNSLLTGNGKSIYWLLKVSYGIMNCANAENQ
jgi:hypothetical protein